MRSFSGDFVISGCPIAHTANRLRKPHRRRQDVWRHVDNALSFSTRSVGMSLARSFKAGIKGNHLHFVASATIEHLNRR
jgi:hypothetical protein